MKKIAISLLLLLAALGARAQFTYGLQFGLYTDNATSTNSATGVAEKANSAFNYSIKPTLGYYFTPGFMAGIKLNYTNCSMSDGDYFSFETINSYAMNLLMGNGVGGNYRSVKLTPYVRVRAVSFLDGKLGAWLEVGGYYGVNTPRVDGVLDKDNQKQVYGVEIHPLVSYNVTDRYMIYTSLDYPSVNWDASLKRDTKKDGSIDTKRANAFLFQANPLVAVARGFMNIGVMRVF